jgi:hypothetical protein
MKEWDGEFSYDDHRNDTYDSATHINRKFREYPSLIKIVAQEELFYETKACFTR